jgi:transposase
MLKFFAKLPPCLVGIKACAASHYWARELVALGYDVTRAAQMALRSAAPSAAPTGRTHGRINQQC